MGASFDSAENELVRAVEAALADVAEGLVARARRDDDAEGEGTILARHAWVLGSSALDILGESRERGSLDAATHAALASHLGRLAMERELVDVRARLRLARGRPLRVDDSGAPLGTLLREASSLLPTSAADRARTLDAALDGYASRVHARAFEALSKAREAAAPYTDHAKGDPDRAEDGVADRAARVLAETDDLADEALDFARSTSGTDVRSPFALVRALRVAELDDLVPETTRAQRIAAWLRPFGFARPLERHASVVSTRPEPSLNVQVVVPRVDAVRLLVPRDSGGVLGELAMLEGVGRALAILGASPASPTLLRRPRRAFTGRMLGAVLARSAFDPRTLASNRKTPDAVLDRARRVAAARTVFALRIAAARVLAVRGTDAPEVLSRATRADWPSGLAALATLSLAPDVRFDAARAGLALTRALRERYDEEYLRHPEGAAFLGSVVARAAIERPGVFLSEVSAGESVGAELRGFFEGRLR